VSLKGKFYNNKFWWKNECFMQKALDRNRYLIKRNGKLSKKHWESLKSISQHPRKHYVYLWHLHCICIMVMSPSRILEGRGFKTQHLQTIFEPVLQQKKSYQNSNPDSSLPLMVNLTRLEILFFEITKNKLLL